MASNKWAKQLKAYDYVVDTEYDPTAPENVIRTGSPSINFAFANKSHGLPKNAGLLLYAPPKAGKSLIAKSFIREIQQADPEAITIEYNTEFRGSLQGSSNIFGIDTDRHIVYETNRPAEIFDHITKDVAAMVQAGMPLKLVVIDSLTFIGGVKTFNADSVEDHLIGDKALTVTKGLEQIVPWLKRNKIPLIATAHLRVNIDPNNPRAPKEKAAVGWMAKHTFEVFMSARRANAADDKQDIHGEAFDNKDSQDIRGNNDLTGHKIIFKVEESSLGAAGRTGMITLDYKKGIVNQHEELFELAKNRGIIKSGGAGSYEVYGEKVRGKANVSDMIRDNAELYQKIIADLKKLDA